ncbi:hypothetical protein V6N11_027244 [Hibiscus sabdariffa]|uniref:Uncharacterized protein n=1 Tax=Hibiscus sabdariffa TaxID=183260 RepID=A0ABR2PGC6_9ROSI
MGNSSGDRVIHDYQTNNNNVAVDENMTDGGYIVNPFPADEDMANPQGHGVNPSEGYNVNPIPADEDMANPQEHGVNPSEGYNVNPIPADEDMANPLDFAIPSPNGFGGEYDDILDTLGFGLQGSEGGFF